MDQGFAFQRDMAWNDETFRVLRNYFLGGIERGWQRLGKTDQGPLLPIAAGSAGIDPH